MPTVNKRVLLRLLAVTLVCAVGLFVLHQVQADRIPEGLRWQAEHAAEQGKTDLAIFYTRQYLEFRPQDYDAAENLGKLILSRGNSQRELNSVLFLYERVAREAPHREEVRRKLVDLCIRLNRTPDALIHLEPLLEKHPDDAQLWEQTGVCQVVQNRFDEARQAFEKSLQLDPTNVRGYELLAQLLERHLHQPEAARACLERMAARNPDTPEAFLARAQYWKGVNKPAECLKDLDRVLELSPEQPDALLMSAEILQTRGDIPRARQTLLAAAELYPREVRVYRSLSWLEVCLGNATGAITCLEQGVKELPQAADLLTPLADLVLQQGDAARARDIVRQLEGKRALPSQVQYLKARLLMQEGKWSAAVDVLEPLRTEAVSMPGLAAQLSLLLSTCHAHLGDRDAEAESLQRVLTIDPGHLAARLALGSRFVTDGRWDDAIKEYTIAAQSPYAPLGVYVTLGRLRIARARAESGGPDEWRAIEAYAASLRQRFKQSAEPVILAAECLAARREGAKAARLLREEVGKKLYEPRLWVTLAEVVEQTEGRRAALEVLDEAQGVVGDQVDLRLARGQVWSRDPAARQPSRLQELERSLDEFGDADQLRLLSGMAELYASVQDRPSLKRVYRMLADRRPRDAAVRKALAQELARDGDSPELARVKTELAALEGEANLSVAVLEMERAVEQAKPDTPAFAEVRERLAAVVRDFPDRADALFLTARLADRSGDVASATRHYVLAVEADRSSLRFVESQLAFLLRNRPEEARKLLNRLCYDARLTPGRVVGLVETVLTSAPEAEARKCMQWLDRYLASEPRACLWLGEFLERTGQPKAALAVLRRCVEGGPTLPDGWAALVRVSASAAGEADWQKELTRARAALRPDQFFQVCAVCGDAIRAVKPGWTPAVADAGERRMYAQACVDAALSRGRPDEANLLLKQVAADRESRPEDVAWAKRNQTMIALQAGKAGGGWDALNTWKQASAGAASTVEELRGRAELLATAYRQLAGPERQTVRADLEAALKALTAHADANTRDWFLQAQFQRQWGDRPAYRKSLRALMQREPENLFFACAYLDELLADNDLKDAVEVAARLRDGVSDFRAARSLARFHCLADAPGQALEVVERFAQAADPGTPDALVRLRQAAELLDQLTRLAGERGLQSARLFASAGEARYRAAVQQFPEETEHFAAFLGHLNRVGAALEVIEQKKDQLSARAIASAGLAAVRDGKSSPRQFATVRRWIDAAVAEQPGSVVPRLELAEFHTIQHDFAAAEQAYRAILRSNPNQVVALNNLAWVLASRPDSAAEALGYIDRAIRSAGASGDLLDTRARILIAAGRYDRAVDDLQDALSQSPTSLRYFHLAVAQLKRSKRDDALSAFRKAKAHGLDPKAIQPSDLPAYRAFSSETGG